MFTLLALYFGAFVSIIIIVSCCFRKNVITTINIVITIVVNRCQNTSGVSKYFWSTG